MNHAFPKIKSERRKHVAKGRWYGRFGRRQGLRHIIPISGKDSLATAVIQIAREPNLPYELIFNPTGLEPKGVIEWLDRVSAYLSRPIIHVGEPLLSVMYDKGFLPATRTRYCTQLSKIFPTEDYILEDYAFVYYGLRADEPARVGYEPKKKGPGCNIVPKYPLREFNMGIEQVWKLVSDIDLLPPPVLLGKIRIKSQGNIASTSLGILDRSTQAVGTSPTIRWSLSPELQQLLFSTPI